MMQFGLSDKTLSTVRQLLGHYPAVEKAIIYGSRAKGNYKRGSDIDLTLTGDSLDYRILSDIAEALDESPIPYTVDLSLFDHIDNQNLREHIERVGKVLYQREMSSHSGVVRKAGWQTKKLGDVCDVIGGGTPSKGKAYVAFYSGDIRWATVRDMKSDLISDTEFKITKEAVKASATNVIPKGNVVIATRVGLGKVCLIEHDTAINQDLRGIVPKDAGKLVVPFLFWWLKSVAHLIVREGTGATVQGVKLPFIKSLSIPTPPLPEQQRIVAILDEAFEGIATATANAEKNLNNARELFDAHVQRFLFSTEAGWEEKKLADVVSELITVPFGSMLHKSDYVDDGIPVVNPQNMIGGKIIPLKKTMVSVQTKDRMAKYCLRENDIVIARRGEMGRCGIVDKTHAGWLCGTGSMVMRLKVNANVQYIAQLLQASTVRKRLEGNAIGATMSNLNQAILLSVKFRLPPVHTQQAIIAKLDELSTETKKLEAIYQQKLVALDELKKSILHQAFSGQLY